MNNNLQNTLAITVTKLKSQTKRFKSAITTFWDEHAQSKKNKQHSGAEKIMHYLQQTEKINCNYSALFHMMPLL